MGYVSLSLEKNRRLEVANFSHFAAPVRHPDRVMAVHDLVYLVRGAWDIAEEGETFHLVPGDLVFLCAGRRHHGPKHCAPGTRTLWVHVFPEQDDQYQPGACPLSDDESRVCLPTFMSFRSGGEIKARFEGIIHHAWSSSPARRLTARLLVSQLFMALASQARGEPDPSAGAIDTVLAQLETHPEKAWTLDALAALVGLERRTLTTHFRRRAGTSIHRYLLEHRLRMAASLLRHTPGMGVRAAAAQFGFYDEFHFSRAFKRYHGKSPARFMREGE